MLRSDLKHDFVRSHATLLDRASWDASAIASHLDGMRTEGSTLLRTEGVSEENCRFTVRLDMRYSGQYHEVMVDMPESLLRTGDLDEIRRLFSREHNRLYGYDLCAEGTQVELVNIRLTAIGLVQKPALPAEPFSGADTRAALKGRRPMYLGSREDFLDVDVYDGDRLRHGNALEGPALIETVNTTVLVPESFHLNIDAVGTCVLTATDGGNPP
jgi:N-methylhydantoinase A